MCKLAGQSSGLVHQYSELRIEEDIRKPTNLASAAVKFLSFTVVSRN